MNDDDHDEGPLQPSALALGSSLALWVALIGLFLIFTGCTYTDVRYGDAHLRSFRLWTDTSVQLATPDASAAYSSNADGAAALAHAEWLRGVVERSVLPEQLRARE
jgi:hypothetical protein